MRLALVALDFETFPIGPERLAPRIVCGAFARGGPLRDVEVATGDRLREAFEEALRGRIANQFVAYDMACALYQWPDLAPEIFRAYREGRVHDTRIREGLKNLGTTGEIGSGAERTVLPSLASLARRYLNRDLTAAKEGGWRAHYHELADVPLELWPEAATRYVQEDAWIARQVYLAQEGQVNVVPDVEAIHVRADFAAYLQSAHGLAVDRERAAELRARVEEELDPSNLKLLFEAGIVVPAQAPKPHKGGHRAHVEGCPRKGCECPVQMTRAQPEKVAKAAKLIPRIVRVCAENHLEVPRTEPTEKFPHGQVKVDEETIAELAGLDPVLGQYHFRQERQKLRDSYFPSLEFPFGSGQIASRIHPGFEPLKKTGRNSSRGTTKHSRREALYASVNVQQADPRLREIYLPEPGFVFALADFGSIDLCCLAQTLEDLKIGPNPLLEQLNSGISPHTFLAPVIAYTLEAPFARRFKGLTGREAHDLFSTLKEGTEAGRAAYKEWRELAKRAGLGFAGGMGIARFRALVAKELHLHVDARTAGKIRRAWLRTYPGMPRYFQWVQDQRRRGVPEPFNRSYQSPAGMLRVRCSYAQCANGRALQTPAAEGMKAAMWRVTEECWVDEGSPLYGSRPVLNIHDELVIQVPYEGRDRVERGDAAARRLSEVMVAGMRTVLRDVDVKAEPLLTARWVKEARQVKDERGRIVPWMP